MTESVNADIIFGTQSWLNPSISDSEVFPEKFIAYRNDRHNLGRGVFVPVRSDLSSRAIDINHDVVEAVWFKVNLPDNFSFTMGAVHQPPNTDIATVQALSEVIAEAADQVMLLAGDFNLPDLDWSDMRAVKTCTHANRKMKRIVDTYGLLQYVNDSILDLLFRSSPNFVPSATITPVISDNQALVAATKTKIRCLKCHWNTGEYFLIEAITPV